MNNVYRIIWNKALVKWVVASELAKQGKKSGTVRGSSVIVSMLLSSVSAASFALPTGDQLISGSATVTTPSSGQMQINQNSQNAIINWQGFSIAQHEAVNIQQPNDHEGIASPRQMKDTVWGGGGTRSIKSLEHRF